MKTIYIQVKLFSVLSKWTPAASDHYPVPAGTTAEQLARRLSLPVDQVKLIFINGRRQPADTTLAEGDRIGIFPPVGGG